MQSTYSSPPNFTTNDDLQIYCYCNKLVNKKVAGMNAKNPGRAYYACCNDRHRQCSFFQFTNGTNGTFGTTYIPTPNSFPTFSTLNDNIHNTPTRISNNSPPIYNSSIHLSSPTNSFPSCSTSNKPKSNTYETIDNIHSINSKLEQQLKAQKKRVAFLLSERKNFEDENAELKSHIQSLEYENNQMISQIGLSISNSNNGEIEELNQQIKDLKSQNAELQLNLESIKNDLTKDQEIESLKRQIQLLESNKNSLANSTEEVIKLRNKLELSNKKITNYEREIEKLIKSNKDKELELEKQRKNSDEDILRQIEELKDNYKNLEKHNLNLSETNKILQEKEFLEKKVKALEEDLEESKKG
ncbi:822_t:CDS:2 [Diversispora eburnea]|uniref:822_t:CDS:1 n=1 Tax=Diversispora eburnea TaxID=1213867 RepID=A0A9N8ZND2_9GLOM|nr:822_t:CDS:2 [Diversispora eburnea]